jgi:hypothetical protein
MLPFLKVNFSLNLKQAFVVETVMFSTSTLLVTLVEIETA